MKKGEKTALVVGVLALAAGGVGIAVYLHSKNAASTAPTTPTTPASLPAGIGGSITLVNGQTVQSSTTAGTSFSVALPAGSAWVSLTSSALNGANVMGVITPGSQQPVPLIAGTTDTLTGVWRDASGNTFTGMLHMTVNVPAVAPAA